MKKKEILRLDKFRKRDRKNCSDKSIGQIEVYIEN